jgi:hypothetical protein
MAFARRLAKAPTALVGLVGVHCRATALGTRRIPVLAQCRAAGSSGGGDDTIDFGFTNVRRNEKEKMGALPHVVGCVCPQLLQ